MKRNKYPSKSIAFILGVLLCFTSVYGVMANGVDEHLDTSTVFNAEGLSIGMGESSNTLTEYTPIELGQSGIEVNNLADLMALSREVAAGDDKAGELYVLKENISIGHTLDWSPIGTTEAPFRGSFNGSGYTIAGVNLKGYSSLFGYIEDSTIANINLPVTYTNPSTTLGDSSNNASSGLVVSVQNSRIQCNVYPVVVNSSISTFARNAVVPNEEWRSTLIISKAGHLLDLSNLIAAGEGGFLTGTITISGKIDMSGIADWKGIGTETYPFMADIVGNSAIVSNLHTIDNGKSATGLFPYAKNAKFDGITLLNAQVNGGENTGGLIGYGENIIVENSSITGTVKGINRVGGLIGSADYTSYTGTPIMTYCYSTADVFGATDIGGLIGFVSGDSSSIMVIDTNFTTSNIDGNQAVGGIVGRANVSAATISRCASSGTINTSVQGGGILGDGNGLTTVTVKYCYSASNIGCLSDSGGIAGIGTSVEQCYFSGTISSPGADDPYIVTSAGYTSSTYIFYTNPNSIFYNYNYMNEDPAHELYKKDGSDGFTPTFFSDSDWGNNLEQGEFTVGSDLGFPPNSGNFGTNPSLDVPTKGNYPSLNVFTNSSAPEVFKLFSELSTNTNIINFPQTFYTKRIADDKYVVTLTPGGADFELPQVGDVKWLVNNSETAQLEDATLRDTTNTIAIDNTSKKIYLTSSVFEDSIVTMSSSVTGSGLEGFGVKQLVTIKDMAIRPVYAKVPTVFYNSSDEAKEGNFVISKLDNIQYITFPESVQATSGTVNLQIYDKPDFSGTVTNKTAVAMVVPNSNDSIVQIRFNSNDLDYGKSYKLKFETGSTIREKQSVENLEFIKEYYLKSPINNNPSISFDNSMPLVTENEGGKTSSTTHENDTQLIYMELGDRKYTSYLDGINIANEVYTKLDPTNGKDVIFEVLSTAGTDVNASNFHKFPGEYKFTYSVDDPEALGNPDLRSNSASRTYRVSSSVSLMQKGTPFNGLSVYIDQAGIVKFTDQLTGNNADAVLEQYLQENFVSENDGIYAYKYDYTGKKVPVKIKFNVKGLTNESFVKGVNTAFYLTADNLSFSYTLQINGLVNGKGIIVENTNFEAINTLSRSEAIKFFKAQVIDRSSNKTTDDILKYNFKNVDFHKYDVPQEVEIYIPGSEVVLGGSTYNVSTTVTVTIKKELRYVHPEEEKMNQQDAVVEFWNNKTNLVKNAKETTKSFEFDISYDQSRSIPRDFLIVLKNKKDISVRFTYPNGVVLEVGSQDVMLESTDATDIQLYYALPIEKMYRLGIQRDLNGAQAQQFYIGEDILPANAKVYIPLDKGFADTGLNLYTIDEQSNTYQLLSPVDHSQIRDGFCELSLAERSGEFIVTKQMLDGKTVSTW